MDNVRPVTLSASFPLSSLKLASKLLLKHLCLISMYVMVVVVVVAGELINVALIISNNTF